VIAGIFNNHFLLKKIGETFGFLDIFL